MVIKSSGRRKKVNEMSTLTKAREKLNDWKIKSPHAERPTKILTWDENAYLLSVFEY